MTSVSLNDFARGLLIQWQVVHALVLRETRTRFGAHQLGYLWALVGPIGMIGTFSGMMLIVGRLPPMGDDIVTFLATGFLPFLFFRSVTSAGAAAVSGNKGLLFYPQVQPLDLILARTALETATLAFVAIVILGGTSLWHQSFVIDSVLPIVAGLAMAGMLGVGLGLILCAGSVMSTAVGKLSELFLRPMLWVSGIFYTANDLPTVARKILLLNPVLHCSELVRDGWYTDYTSRYASVSYTLYWCTGLLFVGLVLERVARRKVGTT